MATELTLDVSTPDGKTWLARITGTDRTRGLAREFVRSASSDLSRSGKTGSHTYLIGDGLYESNEGRRRLGRRYWLVERDTITEIARDDLIRRITADGGAQ